MPKTMSISKSGALVEIEIPPMTLRGDRVLILPSEAETKSKGGIIIPETAREKPKRGTIILKGEGEKDDLGISNTSDLEEGMTVWYGKYAGTEFEWVGNEFILMRENDILGIATEETE